MQMDYNEFVQLLEKNYGDDIFIYLAQRAQKGNNRIEKLNDNMYLLNKKYVYTPYIVQLAERTVSRHEGAPEVFEAGSNIVEWLSLYFNSRILFAGFDILLPELSIPSPYTNQKYKFSDKTGELSDYAFVSVDGKMITYVMVDGRTVHDVPSLHKNYDSKLIWDISLGRVEGKLFRRYYRVIGQSGERYNIDEVKGNMFRVGDLWFYEREKS